MQDSCGQPVFNFVLNSVWNFESLLHYNVRKKAKESLWSHIHIQLAMFNPVRISK